MLSSHPWWARVCEERHRAYECRERANFFRLNGVLIGLPTRCFSRRAGEINLTTFGNDCRESSFLAGFGIALQKRLYTLSFEARRRLWQCYPHKSSSLRVLTVDKDPMVSDCRARKSSCIVQLAQHATWHARGFWSCAIMKTFHQRRWKFCSSSGAMGQSRVKGFTSPNSIGMYGNTLSGSLRKLHIASNDPIHGMAWMVWTIESIF